MRNAQSKINIVRARVLLNSRGSVLVETMIAVTILGIIGTSVASSLSTARNSGTKVEEAAIAETIARNHMESVFAATYQVPPSTYPPLTGLDPGYASTAVAQVYIVDETRIEKIIVTVTRDSDHVMVIESLRTQE